MQDERNFSFVINSVFAKICAMKIIEITKEFLRRSGWTQATLAKRAGIHPTTLSRYLHGKIKPSAGEILANFVIAQEQSPTTSTPTEAPDA